MALRLGLLSITVGLFFKGSSAESELICPKLNGFFADAIDCCIFYGCVSGQPYKFSCPSGTFFDPIEKICNWPRRVTDCDAQGNRVYYEYSKVPDYREYEFEQIPDTGPGPSYKPKPEPEYPVYPDTHFRPDTVDEDAFVCPASEGFFPHPRDCKRFFRCVTNKPVPFDCAPGTFFDQTISVCNFPEKVSECDYHGNRIFDEAGHYPDYFEQRKENSKYPSSSNTEMHERDRPGHYPDYFEAKENSKYPASSNTEMHERDGAGHYPDYFERRKENSKYPSSSNTEMHERDGAGHYPDYFERRKENSKYPSSSNTEMHERDGAGHYPDYFERKKENSKYPSSSHTEMHERDGANYYPDYFEPIDSGKYPSSSNSKMHETDGAGYYPDYFEPIESGKYPASSNTDMYATGFIPCSDEYSLHPHPKSCSKFIYCHKYKGFLFECPQGLNFDRQRLTCDFPKNAPC